MNTSLIAPDLRTKRPCLIELRFSKFNQVREFFIDTENDELKNYLGDLLSSVQQNKSSLSEVILSYLQNDERFKVELFDFYKEVLMYFNPNQGLVIDTSEILCRCFGITRNEVQNLISNGAKDLLTITNLTKAGGGCGSCAVDIRPMLKGQGSERKIPEVTFLNMKKEKVAGKSPVDFLREDLFPFTDKLNDIDVEGLVGNHLYVVGDEDSESSLKLKDFLAQKDKTISLFFI
ncbi:MULTISPECIES: (2Fe-2S)-binding protein [Halobacteriovorax]|uniref:(2Fe-2S)-binding protein n=1 Tax=Halobacteriovorax vibrionivorans TaxID=2152716 RepID=A0ABY0IFU6_9BACT|nr:MULTISPECIES: (2Fe-2S)-binding protein [Halobacteriovorax]RZF20973.1 (2Fe-2S)-binding protein [Halobacteriovorax vibrionivorans]TGD46792.1 (2Fe-2S)-binding protein [Halobacteriovorax sp. Y22]